MNDSHTRHQKYISFLMIRLHGPDTFVATRPETRLSYLPDRLAGVSSKYQDWRFGFCGCAARRTFGKPPGRARIAHLPALAESRTTDRPGTRIIANSPYAARAAFEASDAPPGSRQLGPQAVGSGDTCVGDARSPIRIALVRQRYRPDGGGERILDHAISALAAEGTEITLISRNWRSADGSRPPQVDHLKCDPWWITRIGREESFARAAMKAVVRQRPDLIQTHERIPGCDIYRAGDGLHCSWLAERRKTSGALGRLWLSLSPFHRYRRKTERRLFLHPALRAVICNSEMVRNEILSEFHLPPEKLHVIYNGVDPARFHPGLRAHRGRIRRQLAIPDTVPMLAFVGSGFDRKGLKPALHALSECHHAHLAVVGRDKDEAHFVRLATRLGLRGRVHFVGMQEDVGPWYGASDGLLLPTLYDPFPNVVLEAMACGLGVITSDRCGGAELLREGIEGFVCDTQDFAGMTRAIRTLERPDNSRRIGAAAARRVAPYSIEAMTAQLLSLYRTLLDRPVIAP